MGAAEQEMAMKHVTAILEGDFYIIRGPREARWVAETLGLTLTERADFVGCGFPAAEVGERRRQLLEAGCELRAKGHPHDGWYARLQQYTTIEQEGPFSDEDEARNWSRRRMRQLSEEGVDVVGMRREFYRWQEATP